MIQSYFFSIFSICALLNLMRWDAPSDIAARSHSAQALSEQEARAQDDIKKFVPKDYALLDSASGDLNLDGIADLILVLKKEGEAESSNYAENKPEKRPLLILLRNKNNELALARRNDNAVLCYDCGGAMGDPYSRIVIKNGYFSIEHYGGSAERWARIITYKYEKKDNEWFLHRDGFESYSGSEPSKVETKKIKTKKDFGTVKFEAFDIYKQ